MTIVSDRLTLSAFACDKNSVKFASKVQEKANPVPFPVPASKPVSKVASLLQRGKKSGPEFPTLQKDKIGGNLSEDEIVVVTKPTSPA